MSCFTKSCHNCCIECVKVTSVTADVASITLHETQINLADIPVGQMIDLILDPELLPQSTLPVVLTDGTTTIPLWMENGNVMRENVFLPFCRRKARHCKEFAHIRMRFLDDPAHLLVYRSKRY